MKTRLLRLMIAAACCAMFACSQGGKNADSKAEDSAKAKEAAPKAEMMYAPPVISHENEPGAEADSVVSAGNADEKTKPMPMSSSAAVASKDSGRKFIRTADLKFRAKNVVKATGAIEDLIGRQGGYVSYTNLTSNVQNQTTTKVSDDSSLETNYVQVTNNMVVRVPNNRLDTTLKSLAPLVDFLDYRTIKANNIGLKLYGNNLLKRRKEHQQARMTEAVRVHAKKLPETIDALDGISDAEGAADDAILENLALNDSVQYSTINLQLYQREDVTRTLLSNYKDIKAFEPGFGKRMSDALQSGWRSLLDIVVFFAGIWWLVVIAALFAAWWVRRKKNIHLAAAQVK